MPSSKKTSTRSSPFFAPSTPKVTVQTPGGTRVQKKAVVEEHKSSIAGTSANLINAIVGAGIVGIPFAIQQAGLVTGVFLVILCAVLTDKSLRLLVETAKHTNVPSYETLAEACFGTSGFLFVSINMFIMAYGAMVSYLMIIKDTFPLLMGVAEDNYPIKRAILFVVSLLIIVPLSCQRDMADLAKTSRISVTFDCIMVLIVAYESPWQDTLQQVPPLQLLKESILRPDTVFVGLGVLSFAFVCQHSSFIIAGSLNNPTKHRWGRSVRYALTVCALLATTCGLSGYLGFLEATEGNILNSLSYERLPNIARGLLGTTMLFVYPMESFVARHVCVVLLFRGRRAHEGEDSSVLARRDRRISLTLALYILALMPSLLFEDLGKVLAATGAVGGSCLSYIGPGMSYLGVHGEEFLQLVTNFFGSIYKVKGQEDNDDNEEDRVALWQKEVKGEDDDEKDETADDTPEAPSWCQTACKTVLFHILLLPLWCSIAQVGSRKLEEHQEEMALKSPHPIRIGKVQQKRILQLAARRLEEGASGTPKRKVEHSPLVKGDSLHMIGERNVLPPPMALTYQKSATTPVKVMSEPKLLLEPQSSMVGAPEEAAAPEEDPQADPPTLWDFVVAICYMIFGVVALAAGLASIVL